MRAMILAAGRGERLRPITDSIPKPMVKVGGVELLLWHISRLKNAGIKDIIVNSAWLSEKIVDFLGDGHRFSVHITHSIEEGGGLETAGGIAKALPFFGGKPFLVVNGDTYMDADYSQFIEQEISAGEALLFMTENPPHNPQGDFYLANNGLLSLGAGVTFSGAAIYSPDIFKNMEVKRYPLRPVFEKLIANNKLRGRMLRGRWFDVGTIERLQQADEYALRNCRLQFE